MNVVLKKKKQHEPFSVLNRREKTRTNKVREKKPDTSERRMKALSPKLRI